jgi:hypothetical protein
MNVERVREAMIVLEAAGVPVSVRTVRLRVGGSDRDISKYLKALRPPAAAAAKENGSMFKLKVVGQQASDAASQIAELIGLVKASVGPVRIGMQALEPTVSQAECGPRHLALLEAELTAAQARQDRALATGNIDAFTQAYGREQALEVMRERLQDLTEESLQALHAPTAALGKALARLQEALESLRGAPETFEAMRVSPGASQVSEQANMLLRRAQTLLGQSQCAGGIPRTPGHQPHEQTVREYSWRLPRVLSKTHINTRGLPPRGVCETACDTDAGAPLSPGGRGQTAKGPN